MSERRFGGIPPAGDTPDDADLLGQAAHPDSRVAGAERLADSAEALLRPAIDYLEHFVDVNAAARDGFDLLAWCWEARAALQASAPSPAAEPPSDVMLATGAHVKDEPGPRRATPPKRAERKPKRRAAAEPLPFDPNDPRWHLNVTDEEWAAFDKARAAAEGSEPLDDSERLQQRQQGFMDGMQVALHLVEYLDDSATLPDAESTIRDALAAAYASQTSEGTE